MRYCVFMDPEMKGEVDNLCGIVKRDKRDFVPYSYESEVNFSFMVRLFVKEGLEKYFGKYVRRKRDEV